MPDLSTLFSQHVGAVLLCIVLAVAPPLALISTRRELRRVRAIVIDDLRTVLFGEHALPQIDLVAARYRSSSASRSHFVMEWTGGFFFALISLLGWLILVLPLSTLLGVAPAPPMLTEALIWTSRASDPGGILTAASAAGFAFLGGYIGQIRYLIRAALNEELGALTFVRATLTILQGIIIGIVIFRVAGAFLKSGAQPLSSAGLLAAAFAAGWAPDQGLKLLAKWTKTHRKEVDNAALDTCKVMPVEVIDGIDSEIAYRLEESNIYDVQNLATINPLELYAETPYAFYQVFDWVLQAQLCLAVGTSAFHALKFSNIRTIFDLERAVLSVGAPAVYVEAIGLVLYTYASACFRAKLGFPGKVDEAECEKGAVPPDISVDLIRHAVAIATDDVHINRLRELWRLMQESTDPQNRHWLYETGPLPGEPAGPVAG